MPPTPSRPPRRLLPAGLLALPLLATLVASVAPPRSTGMLPDDLFAPPLLTSALPSCGACHDKSPNANGRVTMHVDAAARSIPAGAKLRVDVKVTGGPNRTPTLGGFCLQTDRGTFVAGTTTQLSFQRDAIAHVNKFGNSWQFDFQPPTAPGPVLWTGVAQAVDVSNNPAGDSWGFWGPDSAKPGVPHRLYVNAAKVSAFGAGCAGTDGHPPILGAPNDLTVGGRFAAVLINAPGGVAAFCALGTSDKTWGSVPLPFDLAAIGAPGCLLRIDHVVVQRKATTGGGSGGGSARFDWPLPNDPSMRGATFLFQGYVFDSGANAANLTVSNALRATVQ